MKKRKSGMMLARNADRCVRCGRRFTAITTWTVTPLLAVLVVGGMFSCAGACLMLAKTREGINPRPTYQTGILETFSQDTITGWILPHCYGEETVTCYGGGEVETPSGRPRYYVDTESGKWILIPLRFHADPLSTVVSYQGGAGSAGAGPSANNKFFYRIEDRKGRQHFIVPYPDKAGRVHEVEYRAMPLTDQTRGK